MSRAQRIFVISAYVLLLVSAVLGVVVVRWHLTADSRALDHAVKQIASALPQDLREVSTSSDEAYRSRVYESAEPIDESRLRIMDSLGRAGLQPGFVQDSQRGPHMNEITVSAIDHPEVANDVTIRLSRTSTGTKVEVFVHHET